MIGFSVVGFEEKFIGRCIMRNYRELKKFYLIIPPGKSKKVENVIKIINVIADAAGVLIEEIVLEELNMLKIYQKLFTFLKNALENDEVLLCLSSGLRGVGISLLLAAVEATRFSSPMRIKISVDWEDLSGHEEHLLSEFLSIPILGTREIEVLKLLSKEPMSVRGLSIRLGIPYATLWRTVKRLQNLGFVRRRGVKLEIERVPIWILRE